MVCGPAGWFHSASPCLPTSLPFPLTLAVLEFPFPLRASALTPWPKALFSRDVCSLAPGGKGTGSVSGARVDTSRPWRWGWRGDRDGAKVITDQSSLSLSSVHWVKSAESSLTPGHVPEALVSSTDFPVGCKRIHARYAPPPRCVMLARSSASPSQLPCQYKGDKDGLASQDCCDASRDTGFCACGRVGVGQALLRLPVLLQPCSLWGTYLSSILSPYGVPKAVPHPHPITKPATKCRPISTSQYGPQVLAQAQT